MDEPSIPIPIEHQHIVIASNRGPVALEKDEDGNIEIHRGSGGLVTALSGIAGKGEMTWISCAFTEIDREWGEGTVPFGNNDGELRISFLNPNAQVYDGYYNVIANPLLWFLQHSMWDVPRSPVIDRSTWQAWESGYLPVNRMFAESIARQEIVLEENALVMLQDYHLYMTPRYLREIFGRKTPKMLHFIHIPWPGPEYWGILPPTMRTAILDSLCAVDLLGFQTRDDALNFLRTCESYLPNASIRYKRGRIWYRNHATYIRDFPISIDVEALKEMVSSQEISDYQEQMRKIVADTKMILRIDRIEPSKNIVRGFQAFEEMLELYPEHVGNVTFLALLVPSRMQVDEYQNYLDELMAAAGRINARFGTSEWEPVRLLVGENYPRAVAALTLYDVLLVNAIADGMNLVAKEGPMVNKRDGALVLSERAGARQQLESGATVISPCDVYATAEAMHQGLTMPRDQREIRSMRLRWMIEREDINAWLQHQLDALYELNIL
jgi:trehalose 6-phosphate synthase